MFTYDYGVVISPKHENIIINIFEEVFLCRLIEIRLKTVIIYTKHCHENKI
jgi:hypothetical protein